MFSVRALLHRAHSRATATIAAGSYTALRRQAPSTPVHSASLLTSVRHQSGVTGVSPDAHTSASVVIVDPEQTAKERDRLAREMLSSNSIKRTSQRRSVLKFKDIAHTVPYTLSVVMVTSGGSSTASGDSHDESDARAKIQSVLDACFNMVNTHLNAFNPESEISKINASEPHEPQTMSVHLRRVLQCAVEVYQVSGSCFDPCCSPLAARLRHAAGLSSKAEAEEAMNITAIEAERFMLPNSFDINFKDNTITRKHAEAMMDLGGINKGYTVDCVVDQLNEAGFGDVLFEWGGDCRASGFNVQKQRWAVGIIRPPSLAEVTEAAQSGAASSALIAPVISELGVSSSNTTAATAPEVTTGADASVAAPRSSSSSSSEPALLRVVTLHNEALCTSGDYEHNFYSPVLGTALSSIYDWQTRQLLRPTEDSLSQVSVKCYSCMYADALATASLVKHDVVRVRYMLEHYRRDHNRVTDYVAYARNGQRMAHMFEIAKESQEMRANRIAGSLPARIIVIGAGLAGQAAAIEAANCGATVVLLEKDARLGGNSAKATSGINGWGTRTQATNHVSDNCKLFERDTYLSGVGGTCDPGLVRTLSVKSGEAIEWLTGFGIPLTVLYQLGGASRKRCHRAPDQQDGTPVPIGFTIMRTLEEHIRTKLADKVTILTNTSVVGLSSTSQALPDGTRKVVVNGVTYKDLNDPSGTEMSLNADAVVLATGGFSNDQTSSSLLREYAPQIFGTPTTNGTFATGDGVKMARKLGASLVDMDKVQLHPTGLVDPKDPSNRTKYLGPEALRGSGGILLNQNGERFINELDLRSVVSQAILAQGNEYPGSGGSKFAYCVLSEEAVKLFGVNSLGFYWKQQGLFTRVDDLEGLAKLIGCEKDTLKDTLEGYENLATTNTACPLTGKVVYPASVGPQGPFYVAYVTPSIHYTMGGCLISPSAEVQLDANATNLFEERRPILGLFGAGEVTGGVHGKNRLGGNSLLECVVYGRIAGDRAATILQKRKTALSTTEWAPVVVRESRAGDQFGIGSCVLRFNLPGALQTTGLSVGQFIALRGEWDGQQLVGYYSPITLPDDHGCISILARGDKGNLQEWISNLRPGDAVEMKACGGLKIDLDPVKKHMLFNKTVIRKLGLICGGSGVAPMLQITRCALQRPFIDNIEAIRMVYAAADEIELTYRRQLREYAKANPDKFACSFVLSNPPEGWTGGVGYVERSSLQRSLPPPSKDLLIAICGPPVMQHAVKADLFALGYSPKLVKTVDEDMVI